MYVGEEGATVAVDEVGIIADEVFIIESKRVVGVGAEEVCGSE